MDDASLDIAVRVLSGVAGVALIALVVDSAVRTFVVPRGVTSRFTRAVSLGMRRGFDLLTARLQTYESRDRVMALYSPVTLVVLPGVWLATLLVAFAGVLVAVDGRGWSDALHLSGSSLLTLGFDRPTGGLTVAVCFIEAATGLALLALLIAYLPTIYGAFSRREASVTQLSVRAGTPPSPSNLLIRAHLTGFLTDLDETWSSWERWFVELEETHTSFPALSFFRSPNPQRSWVTAAGTVLDTASLYLAAVDVAWAPRAATCIRAGFLSLRAVGDVFDIDHPADPAPDDPISVGRDEFDAVCDELADAGVPIKADRDQAWRDFAGWRVNYDRVLVVLAGLVMAPDSTWSSDRSAARHRPPLRWRRRVRPETGR